MVKSEHSRGSKKLPATPTASICAFLVALLLFIATPTPVLAVDAVWLLNPRSADWNTGTNWSTSPTAPVNPGDTATFNTSTQTSLTLSGSVTVESIMFQPETSAFTINTNGNVLTMQGAGIVNNSGKTQTFINNGVFEFGGVVALRHSSTPRVPATSRSPTTADSVGSVAPRHSATPRVPATRRSPTTVDSAAPRVEVPASLTVRTAEPPARSRTGTAASILAA